MSKRTLKPNLSPSAQSTFDAYDQYLTMSLDLRPATVRTRWNGPTPSRRTPDNARYITGSALG